MDLGEWRQVERPEFRGRYVYYHSGQYVVCLWYERFNTDVIRTYAQICIGKAKAAFGRLQRIWKNKFDDACSMKNN